MDMNERSLKVRNLRAVLGELFVFLVGGALLFASLYYALTLTAKGKAERSSPYSSERQQINGLPRFDKIDAEVGEVSVQYGAEPSVFIENAYYLDQLSVDAGGVLRIRSVVRNRSLRSILKNTDQVMITLPVLTVVDAGGDVKIDVGSGFSGKKIDISLSGMASARLGQVKFAAMRLDVSGMSRFQADAVRLGELDVDMSGANRVSLINLVPQARVRVDSSGTGNFVLQTDGEGSIGDANVRVSGTGNVVLHGFVAGAPLAVNLSGIATLRYSGEPQIVEMQVSGLARIVASE